MFFFGPTGQRRQIAVSLVSLRVYTDLVLVAFLCHKMDDPFLYLISKSQITYKYPLNEIRLQVVSEGQERILASCSLVVW